MLFFVFLCFSSYGQDSLLFTFIDNEVNVSTTDTSRLSTFFKGRVAESISLNTTFLSGKNASKNRLLAEFRLHNVHHAILNLGLPFNIISTTMTPKDDSLQTNVVKASVFFAEKKTYGVLKETSVVQISEFDFGYHRKNSELVQNTTTALELGNKETENEIVLDPAAFKKDATVSLPNLIFQGSTHYFLSISERVLRALLKVMKTRTDIEIELQGHVCCNPPGVDAFDIGTGKKNLSIMRAKAVYDYLIAGGISASRMRYRGFGSSKRLYPEEKNSNEKMLNRRVEVLITASD